MGATELQGPVNYKYKDLKSATENFSDENKLGEGGFGDVYKVKKIKNWCTIKYFVKDFNCSPWFHILSQSIYIL